MVAQVDDDEEELDNNFRQMQRLRKEKKLLSTIPEGPEDAAEFIVSRGPSIVSG